MCIALSQRDDAELASRAQNFGAPGKAFTLRARSSLSCSRSFVFEIR
jgi:hypothetical protein